MRTLTDLRGTLFHDNRFRPLLFLKSVGVGLLTGLIVVAQAASICLVAVLLEATRDRAV